jgi:hypothetical protein
MQRFFFEVLGSALGLAMGAVIVFLSAKAGLWAFHTFGFWQGCGAFLMVLLGGTGLLYLWLGGDDKGPGDGGAL